MDAHTTPRSFLAEFSDFVKFLQTLWGILAGISIFFPLSNVLLKLIPMGNLYDDNPGGLTHLTPALITTLATVATLFVILITFGQRRELRTRSQRETVQRQAWLAFGGAFLALVLYYAVYFGIYPAVYAPLNIGGSHPLALIGDFLLLLFFGAFFALLTRAFMLLGMLEYFGKAKPAAAAGAKT